MMKIGAVMLAAGQGRRFGSEKLLTDLSGRPVVDHVLDAMATYRFDAAVGVVRPDSPVIARLKGRTIIPAVNRDADLGMGTSLAAGVRALPPVDATFIILADMPGLPSWLFGHMVSAMMDTQADIVVPVHGGQQGHPVLFASRCFADLMELHGDTGAKALIRSGVYSVTSVESDNAGVLRDIDRPDDLDGFR